MATRLGRLGCTVRRAQPEGLGDHREFFAMYLTLHSAITSARLPAEQRRATAATMRTRDDEWSRATQHGIEAGARQPWPRAVARAQDALASKLARREVQRAPSSPIEAAGSSPDTPGYAPVRQNPAAVTQFPLFRSHSLR